MVPRSSVPRILHSIHDRVFGGHLEFTKIITKLRERFYWQTYKDDVEDWIRCCVTYAATQDFPDTELWQNEHIHLRYPFEGIAMDLARPFSTSHRGNQHTCSGRLLSQMVWGIASAHHRCPRNSQGLCGKLDPTLWCPIGAAQGPRKELRIKSVLRDVQALEDQQESTPSICLPRRLDGLTGVQIISPAFKTISLGSKTNAGRILKIKTWNNLRIRTVLRKLQIVVN